MNNIISKIDVVKSERETWAGWCGRQSANGILLFLAYHWLKWMGIVIVIQRCGP